MTAQCAKDGAPRVSKACRTPLIPSELAKLEADFWRLWSMFPTAEAPDLDGLHKRLNSVVRKIAKTPITSMADVVVKARVARQRGGWTLEFFGNEPEDHPQRVAAEMLDEVVWYLENKGDAG